MSNNAGQYSVSIAFSLPWKKEKKPNVITEVKKRKKTLKPVINPIFEKCANLTEDEFWNSIFMDCSRGKFPRGFFFKNNLLTHKRGSKMTTLEISKSATETYTDVINFFQVKAGIMSQEDRKRLQQREDERILEQMEKEKDISWGQIRKENLKEVLLNEFICDLCERMDLNEEEKRELITTIKKGIMLKCFNSNNIIMSEGKIVEIDGLIYNEETREYEIDDMYIQKKAKKETSLGIEKDEKNSDINFLEIWRKYLEGLENKRNKKVTSFSVTQNEDSVSKTYDLSYTT